MKKFLSILTVLALSLACTLPALADSAIVEESGAGEDSPQVDYNQDSESCQDDNGIMPIADSLFGEWSLTSKATNNFQSYSGTVSNYLNTTQRFTNQNFSWSKQAYLYSVSGKSLDMSGNASGVSLTYIFTPSQPLYGFSGTFSSYWSYHTENKINYITLSSVQVTVGSSSSYSSVHSTGSNSSYSVNYSSADPITSIRFVFQSFSTTQYYFSNSNYQTVPPIVGLTANFKSSFSFNLEAPDPVPLLLQQIIDSLNLESTQQKIVSLLESLNVTLGTPSAMEKFEEEYLEKQKDNIDIVEDMLDPETNESMPDGGAAQFAQDMTDSLVGKASQNFSFDKFTAVNDNYNQSLSDPSSDDSLFHFFSAETASEMETVSPADDDGIIYDMDAVEAWLNEAQRRLGK